VTFAVICSISAELINLHPNIVDEADDVDEVDDVGLNRTFILKDSKFKFPSIGWPLDKPKYDFNGFRLPVSRTLKNGMIRYHKRCSRRADCYISPSVMNVPEYGSHCSEFKEIFKKLRHCEILSVKNVKNKECMDMQLDNG